MRWHAQVAHVMRKDLRASRAHVVAYVVVVLGATAAAVTGALHGAGLSLLWMISVIVMGVVVTALLIHADSPRASNAFWITLPLHRSAVLAAKVTGVILLLLLPLAGQFAALRAHGVPVDALSALLGRSALSYAAWLGMGAVIAALTPDFRTFAVGLVIVWVAETIAANAIIYWVGDPWSGAPPFYGLPRLATMVCGALFVLAHQYRTRNLLRSVMIAAGILIAGLAVPLVWSQQAQAPAPAAAPATLPEALSAATLAVGETRMDAGEDPWIGLQLNGASDVHQYLLIHPVARLHGRDGSSVPVEFHSSDPHLSLNSPLPRLEGETTWLGERTFPPGIIKMVRVRLSPEQRAALRRGDARLTLEGSLEVRAARVWADLPLATGANAASGGRRVRVVRVENSGGRPVVELDREFVGSPSGRGSRLSESRFDVVDHVLVNPASGEAVALRQAGGSGSSFGLVLPGPDAWTTRQTFELGRDSDSGITDRWLRQARLHLIEWVTVGSAPVGVTAPPVRESRADATAERPAS